MDERGRGTVVLGGTRALRPDAVAFLAAFTAEFASIRTGIPSVRYH